MKIIKNIIIWSIIAVILQSAVFFTADKYYKNSLMNTKTTEVKIEDKSTNTKNIDINIPSSATKVESSFDGEYLSYYENNILNVINTSNGEKETVPAEKNNRQIYSKWLPDINIIILCEKSIENPTEVSIYTYNAENNSKKSPTDSANVNIKFHLSSSKDKISDIEFSTAMNTFYIKTLKTNGNSDIFFNDVNGNMNHLITSTEIGTIKAFKNIPGLIYENLSDNVITFTNNKKSIDNENYCILSTDDNENIYIGILKDSTVTKILYGSREADISKWYSIDIETPVNKDNIIMNKENLYIKYPENSYILNKQNNKKTIYKGNFLAITSSEVLSLENGKLQRTKLN